MHQTLAKPGVPARLSTVASDASVQRMAGRVTLCATPRNFVYLGAFTGHAENPATGMRVTATQAGMADHVTDGAPTAVPSFFAKTVEPAWWTTLAYPSAAAKMDF